MSDHGERQRPTRPEDLSRLFVERANAGDVEGLVALYEPDAVLAFPPGEVTVGSQAIRRVYQRLLADGPGSPRATGSGVAAWGSGAHLDAAGRWWSDG